MGSCLSSNKKTRNNFETKITASHISIFDVYKMSNKMLGAGYSGFVQRATLKAYPDVVRAVKTIYKKKLETQSTLFIHEINVQFSFLLSLIKIPHNALMIIYN